ASKRCEIAWSSRRSPLPRSWTCVATSSVPSSLHVTPASYPWTAARTSGCTRPIVMAALYRLGRWQEVLPVLDEHLAAFAEETVDMNCPFTRGGPVIGALVLDRLGRPDAAATASESIIPNKDEPGMVEGWMAERAL